MLLQGRLPKSITAYLYDKYKKKLHQCCIYREITTWIEGCRANKNSNFQLISVMVIFKGIFEILRLPNLYCTNYDFFVFMMSLMMS